MKKIIIVVFVVCFMAVFACASETATVVPSGVTVSAVNAEPTAVTKTASPAIHNGGKVKQPKKVISKKNARVFAVAGSTPAHPTAVTSAADAATPTISTVDKQETVGIQRSQVIPPLETREPVPTPKK